MASRIVKGDSVEVTSGKDRGKRGTVAQVFVQSGKVLVHKVNMVKRHQKPDQLHPQGGIIEKEAALAISNVQLVDPESGKPTRIGFQRKEDGSVTRIAKKSGKEIPYPTVEA